MVGPNVRLSPPDPLSAWRKISLGSWRPTGDSAWYSMLELDMEPALAFTKAHGVGVNSFLLKALGLALERFPEMNAIVRLGRIQRRTNCDIFMHVITETRDGEELTGLVMRDANRRSMADMTAELRERIPLIRRGEEEGFQRIKALFRWLPALFSRPLVALSGFVLYSLNLHSRLMGMPRDPFGSIMLTNVGSLGIDNTFSPIAPYTRIPLVVSAGAVKARPFVIEDRIELRKTIKLGLTGDHRIMDGFHLSHFTAFLGELFAQPGHFIETPPASEEPESDATETAAS